jgi:hypothetical protein
MTVFEHLDAYQIVVDRRIAKITKPRKDLK